MENIKKRIGIDARFYGPLGKGLGRYIQEVTDSVISIDTESDYVIFLGPDNFDEFVVPQGEEERIEKVLFKARWYTLTEQLLWPLYIWRQKVDLMHFGHFNVPIFCPVKFVVTIHDLILIKFPTLRASTLSPLKYWLKNRFYRLVIYMAVKNAKKIITVSQFTKNDIVGQFGVSSDKVIVTYEGVANLAKGRDSLFVNKLAESDLFSRYNIQGDFILYVGNAYPHKNLEKLLLTFKLLRERRKDIQLVLVGKSDYFYERLKTLAKELGLYEVGDSSSPVIFAGYVPDAELEILFQKALYYIFPSLYEGFGLPPLEAMAKGCPVLSSDKSCLPEILGEAAFYFNPTDEVDMLTKMEEMMMNQALRENLKTKGREQVKKYSWWECAYQTKQIYFFVLYEA
jgi:glycosyltransferase involved in cell wall biosynthesis